MFHYQPSILRTTIYGNFHSLTHPCHVTIVLLAKAFVSSFPSSQTVAHSATWGSHVALPPDWTSSCNFTRGMDLNIPIYKPCLTMFGHWFCEVSYSAIVGILLAKCSPSGPKLLGSQSGWDGRSDEVIGKQYLFSANGHTDGLFQGKVSTTVVVVMVMVIYLGEKPWRSKASSIIFPYFALFFFFRNWGKMGISLVTKKHCWPASPVEKTLTLRSLKFMVKFVPPAYLT